jgi:hypothetical protein
LNGHKLCMPTYEGLMPLKWHRTNSWCSKHASKQIWRYDIIIKSKTNAPSVISEILLPILLDIVPKSVEPSNFRGYFGR